MVALLALSACGPPEHPLRFETQRRLVEGPATTADGDDAGRPLAHDPSRFERVGGEARPVLRGFPLHHLGEQPASVSSGQPGALRAAFPVPAGLPAGSRLLVMLRARTEASWTLPAPPELRTVSDGPEGPYVAAGLPGEHVFPTGVPQPAPEVRLTGSAREVLDRGGRRIDVGPVGVPPAARLDFGFGVLAGAETQGAVEFSLSVCRDARCSTLWRETLDPRSPAALAWSDRRVPLESFAGQDVVFRFAARPQADGDADFSLPVWSDPRILAPETRRRGTANLVLVSLDTLRADRLPAYGYPRDTAPFMTRGLAAAGAVFEDAFSAASTTGPSHMTAFTALTPSAHGLRYDIRGDRLPKEIPTLAQHLRAAGFATGAVTEDGALAFGSGIERGFESYREFHPKRRTPHRAETTFAAGRAWLERQRDRPFLLFVQTYEVHTPYRAPAETPPLGGTPARHAGPPELRLQDDWRAEAYDREIRYADLALQRFVEGLDQEGLLDDTLLVVFSDHGEAFLEHGYLHHGGGIHDEVLRVPLFFVGPSVPPGTRVRAPVGLVDLMPTLLELLELPVPTGLMGRSFASLVRGDAPEPDWWERPLFSESWAARRTELREGRIQPVDREPPSLAVRQGTRKLIREPGPEGERYAYYDLASDPAEQRDLYASDPEAAADLRRILDDYASRVATEPSADGVELPPDRLEALRILGYVD